MLFEYYLTDARKDSKVDRIARIYLTEGKTDQMRKICQFCLF